MSDLSKNLQLLSTRYKSVSEMCRQLGMNRSQFARYISGESKPTAHNLRKIAGLFHIPTSHLALEHSAFAVRYGQEAELLPNTFGITNRQGRMSLGRVEELKSFSGFYVTYLQSPVRSTMLLQSIVELRFDGVNLLSVVHEKFDRLTDGGFQQLRYDGVVSLLNGCLFIVDLETTHQDTILETILKLPARGKGSIFVGVTMGVTTGQRFPYTSVAVWKFLGKRIDLPAKLEQCGYVDPRTVAPMVRNVFSAQETAFLYPKVLHQL